MLVLIRAITYAALFVGLVLVYLPGRLLSWSGIDSPSTFGLQQVGGLVIGTAGAIVALWCVLSFAISGGGTPAPFDPPRQLVITGPYRFVRNPMYIGAVLVLTGAALYYGSLSLLGFTGIFFLAAQLFVVWYEEPTLRRTFGQEYESYCRDIKRWWPKI